MKNIVLIGMPGAGKSTAGVILAKVLGMKFVDSDLLIQDQEGKLLKDIIEEKRQEGYLEIENQVNRDLNVSHTVIATGGSVVYCPEAMEHLGKIGIVVYIRLSYETVRQRLGNIRQRGVVLKEGQTLMDLYRERCPLYEKYAHLTIEAEGLDMEKLMETITVVINRKNR